MTKKIITLAPLKDGVRHFVRTASQLKLIKEKLSSAFAVCLSFFIFHFFLIIGGFSQNNALVLNGAYVTLNGGTSAAPVYIVLNQPNVLGIVRTVNGGDIISENDYNFIQWETGTNTGSYVYPFGYSTTDYIPFTFNKTAAGGSSSVGVSTYGTAASDNLPLANGVTNMQPSGPVSDANNYVVDRWWRINATGTPTADLTFSYRGVENTILPISCLIDFIGAQRWNGANWVSPPLNPGSACVTSGIGSALANGVTAFSPWVLSRMDRFIPVEMLDISASCNNGSAEVKWSTASEDNNDFFTVERSSDALNYQPIGLVNGAGNSSTIQNYSFTDADPLSGTSYYRLRQTDFNGQTELFSSTSLSSCGNGGLNIVIGQNPTMDGNIWVSISGAENKNVRVSVTDILGKNLYTKNITGITGSYLLNERLPLAGGIYIVNASASDESFSKKIMVVR